MKIYRITYVLNTIAAIKEAEETSTIDGNSYYYENKGMLVYALVKAPNEDEARREAENIIARVREKYRHHQS